MSEVNLAFATCRNVLFLYSHIFVQYSSGQASFHLINTIFYSSYIEIKDLVYLSIKNCTFDRSSQCNLKLNGIKKYESTIAKLHSAFHLDIYRPTVRIEDSKSYSHATVKRTTGNTVILCTDLKLEISNSVFKLPQLPDIPVGKAYIYSSNGNIKVTNVTLDALGIKKSANLFISEFLSSLILSDTHIDR